ncbi:hypothetical protein N0V86_003099 [Didymella sp. IMI 355093]|nr:hypothetical protein N0V86_003099 [Didymella sp. IMI 355093]
MMNETPKTNTVEVDSLRNEAKQFKFLLTDETARADTAEKELEATKKAHDKKLAEASSSMEYVINDYGERFLEVKSKLKNALATVDATKVHFQRKIAEHREGVKREACWAEEIKQFVKESKEKDQKLDDAEREAATATEQVMKIWAEMRRAKDDESRKRKGSGEADGLEVEKARIRD